MPAQTLKASSAQIKAAYLLKLPGFMEWNAAGATSTEAPFVISVVEADDVLKALEELSRGTKVMGRSVRVTRWQANESPVAAQLVYLGAGARNIDRVIDFAKTSKFLVVSDRPSGLAEGAALHFVEEGGRVRFEASPDNAAKQGIKLSARLLAVAARVEGGTP